MPVPDPATLLRRLPPDYQPAASRSHHAESRELQAAISSPETGAANLYTRHEGGLLSRALGTAVHTLLEELARLRTKLGLGHCPLGSCAL